MRARMHARMKSHGKPRNPRRELLEVQNDIKERPARYLPSPPPSSRPRHPTSTHTHRPTLRRKLLGGAERHQGQATQANDIRLYTYQPTHHQPRTHTCRKPLEVQNNIKKRPLQARNLQTHLTITITTPPSQTPCRKLLEVQNDIWGGR